jgi:hypothetical protein
MNWCSDTNWSSDMNWCSDTNLFVVFMWKTHP